VWFGVANDALARAQNFVRAQAKGRPNVTPPGALRVAEAASMLQLMRANTLDGLRRFARAQADSDELTSVGFAVRRLATCRRSHQPRSARLRHSRLQERHAVQHRPPHAMSSWRRS
jgi:hypothetical protein